MIEIKKYETELEQEWDFFCFEENANIQFTRKFLNYHPPKTFEDFSVVLKMKGEIQCLFPGAKIGNSIVSHPGIAFGGLISRKHVVPRDIDSLFKIIIEYYKELKFEEIRIKNKPIFYNNGLDALEEHFLRINGFEPDEFEVNTIIDLSELKKYNSRKKRNIRKFHGKIMTENAHSLPEFYESLLKVLKTRHDVEPTHTLEDLEYLFYSFPEEIKLVCARINDEFVAGTIIFMNGVTWHTQYLLSNSIGRNFGALDAVIDSVIEEAKSKSIKYLSLGRSTEKSGAINENLLKYKMEFGAIPIFRNSYRLILKN